MRYAALLALLFFACPAFSEAAEATLPTREKEIAISLAFEESKLMLAQRQRPWKKTEADAKPGPQALRISGYYKNLLVSSKTTDTEQGYYYDLNRLRLDCLWNIAEKIQARAVMDQEALFNDFSRTADFAAVRNTNQKKTAFLDGDYIYADNRHIYSKFSLYRGYFKYADEKSQVVFGKQLVDWGRCRFWSPTDLFNPVQPTNIERDERIGVDALNLEYSLTPLSNLNLVYAPQKRFSNSKLAAKGYYRAGNYDLFFMGGDFKKDGVVGFGLDGYLGNGGIRAEFTQTFANKRSDYFRAVVGGEYNFPKLSLLGEFFYNGGADDSNPAEFLVSYEYSSKILTLKKYFLGLYASYEVTPLIKLDNYVIYNFDGESVFFNPELRYNIWTNFDLSAGTQLFWGKSDSEFGDYQNLYYAQAKYFF